MSVRPTTKHQQPIVVTQTTYPKSVNVFVRSGQATHSIKNRFKIFCIFWYIFDFRLSRCLLASVLFVTE